MLRVTTDVGVMCHAFKRWNNYYLYAVVIVHLILLTCLRLCTGVNLTVLCFQYSISLAAGGIALSYNSTAYSSKGRRFSFQHPHGRSGLCETLVPEDSTHCPHVSIGIRQARSSAWTHMQAKGPYVSNNLKNLKAQSKKFISL